MWLGSFVRRQAGDKRYIGSVSEVIIPLDDSICCADPRYANSANKLHCKCVYIGVHTAPYSLARLRKEQIPIIPVSIIEDTAQHAKGALTQATIFTTWILVLDCFVGYPMVRWRMRCRSHSVHVVTPNMTV